MDMLGVVYDQEYMHVTAVYIINHTVGADFPSQEALSSLCATLQT